jgi:hypothetical protein
VRDLAHHEWSGMSEIGPRKSGFDVLSEMKANSRMRDMPVILSPTDGRQ